MPDEEPDRAAGATPERASDGVPPAPSTGDPVVDDLLALGFRPGGVSRRGGRFWALPFNRHLRFLVHEYDDRLLLTWSFALGEHLAERGWQVSISDESAVELYPSNDVVVARDAAAVRAEVTRVLATLRLDLGAPDL